MIAVDCMVRGTVDLGTPRKISLSAPTPSYPVNVDGNKMKILDISDTHKHFY